LTTINNLTFSLLTANPGCYSAPGNAGYTVGQIGCLQEMRSWFLEMAFRYGDTYGSDELLIDALPGVLYFMPLRSNNCRKLNFNLDKKYNMLLETENGVFKIYNQIHLHQISQVQNRRTSFKDLNFDSFGSRIKNRGLEYYTHNQHGVHPSFELVGNVQKVSFRQITNESTKMSVNNASILHIISSTDIITPTYLTTIQDDLKKTTIQIILTNVIEVLKLVSNHIRKLQRPFPDILIEHGHSMRVLKLHNSITGYDKGIHISFNLDAYNRIHELCIRINQVDDTLIKKFNQLMTWTETVTASQFHEAFPGYAIELGSTIIYNIEDPVDESRFLKNSLLTNETICFLPTFRAKYADIKQLYNDVNFKQNQLETNVNYTSNTLNNPKQFNKEESYCTDLRYENEPWGRDHLSNDLHKITPFWRKVIEGRDPIGVLYNKLIYLINHNRKIQNHPLEIHFTQHHELALNFQSSFITVLYPLHTLDRRKTISRKIFKIICILAFNIKYTCFSYHETINIENIKKIKITFSKEDINSFLCNNLFTTNLSRNKLLHFVKSNLHTKDFISLFLAELRKELSDTQIIEKNQLEPILIPKGQKKQIIREIKGNKVDSPDNFLVFQAVINQINNLTLHAKHYYVTSVVNLQDYPKFLNNSPVINISDIIVNKPNFINITVNTDKRMYALLRFTPFLSRHLNIWFETTNGRNEHSIRNPKVIQYRNNFMKNSSTKLMLTIQYELYYSPFWMRMLLGRGGCLHNQHYTFFEAVQYAGHIYGTDEILMGRFKNLICIVLSEENLSVKTSIKSPTTTIPFSFSFEGTVFFESSAGLVKYPKQRWNYFEVVNFTNGISENPYLKAEDFYWNETYRDQKEILDISKLHQVYRDVKPFKPIIYKWIKNISCDDCSKIQNKDLFNFTGVPVIGEIDDCYIAIPYVVCKRNKLNWSIRAKEHVLEIEPKPFDYNRSHPSVQSVPHHAHGHTGFYDESRFPKRIKISNMLIKANEFLDVSGFQNIADDTVKRRQILGHIPIEPKPCPICEVISFVRRGQKENLNCCLAKSVISQHDLFGQTRTGRLVTSNFINPLGGQRMFPLR
jgi:hypothetical protein